MSAQPSVDVVAMGLVLADLERRERQISTLRKKLHDRLDRASLGDVHASIRIAK